MIQRYRGDKILTWSGRATWYSIFSRHHPDHHNVECLNCNTGSYVSDAGHKLSGWFHKHHYKLWYWYINRPASKRRTLRRINGGKK